MFWSHESKYFTHFHTFGCHKATQPLLQLSCCCPPVCLHAEPEPAASTDYCRPNSGPEPAADSSPAGPLPTELIPDQWHCWSNRGHHRWGFTTWSRPGASQQETSDRALWGLLRHWCATVRVPGKWEYIILRFSYCC